MDAVERQLIKALQGSLPLAENPYQALGERLGLSEEELVQRLAALKASGCLKRIGAILRHQQSGYRANALAVFLVDAAAIDAVGQALAQSPLVSHSYERKAYDAWPYNLYAMLHSRDAQKIDAFVHGFAAAHGITRFEILDSQEELKKTSMTYYP